MDSHIYLTLETHTQRIKSPRKQYAINRKKIGKGPKQDLSSHFWGVQNMSSPSRFIIGSGLG